MRQPLYRPGMVRDGKYGRLDDGRRDEQQQTLLVEEKDLVGISVHPVKIRYWRVGSGRTHVLVLHGGPGMPFHESLPALTAVGDCSFHYIHQRGCGKSTRLFENFDAKAGFFNNMKLLERALGLGAQVADIERFRRTLPPDEPFVLVGHSWGGFLASLYAMEFPEHVDAVVAVTPAPMLVFPPEGGGLFQVLERKLIEQQSPVLDNFRDWQQRYFDFKSIFARHDEQSLAAMQQEFTEYFAAVTGDAEEQRSSPPARFIGGWMIFAQYFSMGQVHDYRPAAKSYKRPLLAIHGSRDFTVLQSETQVFVDAFPNAELAVIESGHFPQRENPTAFTRIIRDFLIKNDLL